MLTAAELAWFSLALAAAGADARAEHDLLRVACTVPGARRRHGVAGRRAGRLPRCTSSPRRSGLTALLAAVPFAFDAVRLAGAAYLLWMAWQAVKPGGQAPFAARTLPIDPPARLFRMGFLANVLNPKVAMFYLSFFPQFLHPERGSVLGQSAALGAIQISVSGLVNLMLVLGAASITAVLSRSEGWLRAQRYVMGNVLALLAVRIAVDTRKASA